MGTVTLKIPSISCHHCIMTIRRESGLVRGVEFVGSDLMAQTATFRVEGPEALAELKKVLTEAGYPPA